MRKTPEIKTTISPPFFPDSTNDSWLFRPFASVGSLPQETVFHKLLQYGSFPEAMVFQELFQHESFPGGSVPQE